jgi:hypothetical protein
MGSTYERRTGCDRRQADTAPAFKLERRRSIDSRKSIIDEISISEAEWINYFGKYSREETVKNSNNDS